MNQIVQTAGNVPARTALPTRQRTVGQSLKKIREVHLTIWSDFEAMAAAYRLRSATARVQAAFLRAPLHRHFQVEREETRQEGLQYLRQHRELQPSLDEVHRIAGRIDRALDQGFDEPQVRVCLGLMVDAFPNARPHSPEAYVETLVHELSVLDLPTAAIAKGCNVIVTTAKFLPAASEVIEQCKDATAFLRSGKVNLDRYVAWAETALDAAEWLQVTPLWDRASGADRLAFEGNDPW